MGKGANLGEPLLKFRNHDGQISKRLVEEQQSLADEVAWENFVRFGLEGEFVKAEVCLMRRLGLRAGDLSRRERARTVGGCGSTYSGYWMRGCRRAIRIGGPPSG